MEKVKNKDRGNVPPPVCYVLYCVAVIMYNIYVKNIWKGMRRWRFQRINDILTK